MLKPTNEETPSRDIPVAQCLAILKRAGYDGWVSIEYEGNEDCIEGITKGLQYLKKVIS